MRTPAVIYVSLALLTFVLAGLVLDHHVAATDDSYRYLSNFSDTLDLVEKNYVDEVDAHRLMDGAYRGLLESLDPDSYYLEPGEVAGFKRQGIDDARPGVGLTVSKRHGYAVVVALAPGSPAEGKLAPGDYIRAIDDASTRPMSRFEIVERLAGEAGTQVRLKVQRRDDPASQQLTLTRSVLAYPPFTRHDHGDGVVRFHVRRLDDPGLDRLSTDLAGLAATAVLLDLRGCVSGPIGNGARLAELFLDHGTLLQLWGKTGLGTVKRTLAGLELRSGDPPAPPPAPVAAPTPAGAAAPTPAEPAAPTPDGPATTSRPAVPGYRLHVTARPERTVWRGTLLVLIDGSTAGAAEVAAAALRDHRRAELLGARSFGSAGIQELIPLEDGAAIHLTVARLIAPGGDVLLGNGVEPTETITGEGSEPGDPVLDKALERLRSHAPEKKAA
jgi:carboxyl-terminal processing protease